MSPRARLPGAEELFRPTSGRDRNQAPARAKAQEDKSTNLQVAQEPSPTTGERKAPKHDEKVTFYCTAQDLMALERARLSLRAEHGVAADRGRIVRAALAYILEDFETRGADSVLLRELRGR
ncbi:MAG: hypothetical protein H0V50_01460 [Thermoleophilaceae bacterium]|nr:hypothetical protein [Thermoleophilaceae bacterium]